MSEIKGQLLGLLLVIGVFGAISGIMIAGFKSAANKVSSNMEGSIPSLQKDDGPYTQDYLGVQVELA